MTREPEPVEGHDTERGEAVDLPPPEQFDLDFAEDLWEPVVSRSVDKRAVIPDRFQEILERAMAPSRYEFIGASAVESAKEDNGKRRSAVRLVAFRYDDLSTVEVLVDANTEDALDVRETPYQPDLSDAEISKAVRLASDDAAVRDTISEDDRDPRIIRWEPGADDETPAGRYAQVGFGSRIDRLPVVTLLVDLRSEQVIRSDLMREGD